jgi:DNA polymerase III gamma/tau subunit
VDDLDSINKQSQQVFRNYLDKYKGHVCMIAACSNSQKVIESLQSRLHIIAVQPPTTDKIAWTLDTIAEKEDIRLGEGARAYLLSRSHNSVRNVINNLEKLDIYRPVVDNSSTSAVLDKEVCEKLCSTISFRPFEQYLDALKRGHLQEAIQVIYGIYNYGYSVIDILEYFFEFVKITPMLTDAEKYEIAPHICNYITIFHDMHEHSIELALFTRKVFQVTAVDVPL